MNMIDKIVQIFKKGFEKPKANLFSLGFNKEQDGLWYFDCQEWKGEHQDLQLVNGADSLISYINDHYPCEGTPSGLMARVKVWVYRYNEKDFNKDTNPNFIKLTKIESDKNGASYCVTSSEDFHQTIWIGLAFYDFWGEYPNFIYIKKPIPLKKDVESGPSIIGSVIELENATPIKYLIHYAAPYTGSGEIEVPAGTKFLIRQKMRNDAYYMSLVNPNQDLYAAMDEKTIREEADLIDVKNRLSGYSFFITDKELSDLNLLNNNRYSCD